MRAILSRCLDGVDRDGVEAALARYEATRKERTSKMQVTSRQNVWGKGVTDVDWVYGYNAWEAPLAPALNRSLAALGMEVTRRSARHFHFAR